MRKHTLVGFLSAFAVAATGCASSSTTSVQPAADKAGHTAFPLTLHTRMGTVTISHRPSRIVSLSATATEMLYAIGAGPQVVAVDKYSTYPSSAPRTNLTGFSANAEAIARFRSDLVITDSATGSLSKTLGALHVPLLVEPAAASFNVSYQQLTDLGAVTDHAAGARASITSMRTAIARLVASVPRPHPSLRIYHELDPTFYSATSGTFIGQIYRLFGLRNIADKAPVARGSGYPQLSAEYVLAADPQIIVLADTTCCHQNVQTVAHRPGWSLLDAVRRGLVLGVPDALASEWGPRIVGFIARVATLVKRAETVYGPGT